MNKIFFIKLIFAVVISDNIFSQDEPDSAANKSVDSNSYKFEFNLKPQDGYSFILGFRGSIKDDVEFYNLEVGIARTIISTGGHEGSTIDRTITIGYNNNVGKTFYSIGFGYNLRSFFDIGLFLNYNNNFSGSNAFTLRPHLGFVFLPPIGSIYAEFGYNINFLKNDFDIPNLAVAGFRYNIGILKR